MALIKDHDAHEQLKATVGRRLRVARLAAGLDQDAAAKELGHKGSTQVCIAENGGRLPPILDLMKYADLYGVPLDFILGRHDDHLAESEELGSSALARVVSQSIQGCFEKFSNAVSEHTSVCLANQRQDREDLKRAAMLGVEARQALKRLKELNPDYEDLRGGAKLDATLGQLAEIAERLEQRIQSEQRQLDMIDKALQLEQIETRVKQFSLVLTA